MTLPGLPGGIPGVTAPLPFSVDCRPVFAGSIPEPFRSVIAEHLIDALAQGETRNIPALLISKVVSPQVVDALVSHAGAATHESSTCFSASSSFPGRTVCQAETWATTSASRPTMRVLTSLRSVSGTLKASSVAFKHAINAA